jgi:hypothetical protein
VHVLTYSSEAAATFPPAPERWETIADAVIAHAL